MKKMLMTSVCVLILFSGFGCASQNSVKPEELAKLEAQNKDLQSQIKSRDDEIDALNEKVMSLSAEATNIQLQRDEQVKAFSNLIMSLQGEISASNATVKMSDNAVNVTLLDKIFFAEGSADISESGKASLDKLVPVLKKTKGELIRVEGYTDDVPIAEANKQKFPSNWELSTARATNIVQYLIYGPVPGTPFHERVMRDGLMDPKYATDPESFYREGDGFRSFVRHPVMAPAEIEAIHRFRNEARSIDYFVLPISAAGDSAAPSDEDLKKVHTNDLLGGSKVKSFSRSLPLSGSSGSM